MGEFRKRLHRRIAAGPRIAAIAVLIAIQAATLPQHGSKMGFSTFTAMWN